MSNNKHFFDFNEIDVSFSSSEAAKIRTIYFPLSGIDAHSIKSSITPFLSGAIKIDQNKFLTKPVSTEDLRFNQRNFFINVKGKGVYSIADDSPGSHANVEIGQLWHQLTKVHPNAGVEFKVLNFIPVSGDNVEVMKVSVKNISDEPITFSGTSVLPIFGRTLSNKHDHEHVTSLLQRTKQLFQGVLVKPTMVFNEEGHKANDTVYYVWGIDERGENPIGSFPTVSSFLGDGGHWSAPEAVINNLTPKVISEEEIQGKEAVGALRFKEVELAPEESITYILIFGISTTEENAIKIFDSYNSHDKVINALNDNKKYWYQKTHALSFATKDKNFNKWMSWVVLQPIFRRIFGNSFLPDHDYGKGGKGWRDIWQDLLSLLLIEPEVVRDDLIHNFAGVRVDGTNATIIGTEQGEFIADRNAIMRVWMDHGLWPFNTIELYINQTGDFDILFKESAYFRDSLLSRSFKRDLSWNEDDGKELKTSAGQSYMGSILEHLIIQHVTQFFNVGDHNIIRLEGADWNDGLDMASEKGESVAFTTFYGGNLLAIADLLEKYSQQSGQKTVKLLKEISILLDSISDQPLDYNNIVQKLKALEQYFEVVEPTVSGEQIEFNIEEVIADLRKKGQWIFDHVRKNEIVTNESNGEQHSWFNGYYDNAGLQVEGTDNGSVRMTLTGQVFPIMSGLASDEEIKDIIQSVRANLKDRTLGGFRLNTDFGVDRYLDIGRAFSFAFGTKENGAFFSHMAVMYAYALYFRGFAKEGFEVLNSIYDMSMDSSKAKIYPGVPEYFDSQGKGMYHFLTGSASWYVLTLLTQVFGVRGEAGDLILEPKIIKDQYAHDGIAKAECSFVGKPLCVMYSNKELIEYGEYHIKEVFLNDSPLDFEQITTSKIRIKRSQLENSNNRNHILVKLSR